MDDCLIVGAGVVGLSLAYELQQHGMRIRVIDRGLAGREASWAGAGILPPANRQTSLHPLDQLRALSHELYPAWSQSLHEETGIDNGYRRCGGIYVARSAGEVASLSGLVGLFREQEIEVSRLSGDELRQLEPALTPAVENGSIRAAYVAPDEAQLRNPHHLQALAKACRQRGVEILEGIEALDFETQSGRAIGVRTTDGILQADRFAITTGAWTYRLLRQMGIPNGIMPIRGQMVLFRCDRQPFGRVINEGPRYMVARDDGHVLVGSSEEEAGYEKATTEPVIAELQQMAWDLLPELRKATIQAAWSGLRPGTFDGMPYLGAIPDVKNIFVAAGHYRSGLHMAPGTAVVMSQLIRGETPQIDLFPFRIGRG